MSTRKPPPIWRICRAIALQESRALRAYARMGTQPPRCAPTAWPWSAHYVDHKRPVLRDELLPDATDRSEQTRRTA